MHIFFRGTITMIMLNETQNYLKHQVTKPYTFGLFDLEKKNVMPKHTLLLLE